ncbi:hypothetical protein AOLI_G00153490 [Acnodon oligacanthus]
MIKYDQGRHRESSLDQFTRDRKVNMPPQDNAALLALSVRLLRENLRLRHAPTPPSSPMYTDFSTGLHVDVESATYEFHLEQQQSQEKPSGMMWSHGSTGPACRRPGVMGRHV